MHWYKPNFDSVERYGHKQGRFAIVVNSEGFLHYADGAEIDLHKALTQDKRTIQIMPIYTNIMRNSGLLHGGMMLVERGAKPKKNDIVVVNYNGAVVTRRLRKSLTQWALFADDPREEKLLLNEFANYQLIGVVRHVIVTL